MAKDQAFKFKTNLPEKILFQSDVVKEGVGEYGAWKMYKIQVEGKDYVFFPSKGLQDRFTQIGKLEGRMLEIGKYEDDQGKNYWQICDEKGDEIDFDQNHQSSVKTPQNSNLTPNQPLVDRIDKAAELMKAQQAKINELETRIGVLEMEIKELI